MFSGIPFSVKWLYRVTIIKQVVQQLRNIKSTKKHERHPPRLILENFHRTMLSANVIRQFIAVLLISYNYQPTLRNFEFIVMRCPRTLKLPQNQNIPLVFIFGGGGGGGLRATFSVHSNE